MFKLQSKEECFQGYHYFYIKEYSFFQERESCSSEEIVRDFIRTNNFVSELPPLDISENVLKAYSLQEIKIEESQPLHGPFKINNLAINDFQRADGEKFESIIKDFENEDDWGEDLPQFKENAKCSFRLINRYDISKGQIFYLNKSWFENTLQKLTRNHSLYTYYLTFIIVNCEQRRLLLLEYGYD